MKDMTVEEFMVWARCHAYPADTPQEAARLEGLAARVEGFDVKAAKLFRASLRAQDKLAAYLRERFSL